MCRDGKINRIEMGLGLEFETISLALLPIRELLNVALPSMTFRR